MRRRLIDLSCASLLLAVVATRVQANPGVALRWNHCYGEETGLIIRSFACDTNVGQEVLVGWFVLPYDLDQVSGNEIVVDLATSFGYAYSPIPGPSVPIPEWWRFMRAGSCRQNALSWSTMDPDNQVCQDWGAGQASGFVAAYQLDTYGTGTARILMVSAVPTDGVQSLSAGSEYHSFTIRIRHDKTAGEGACGGCDVPLGIIFNSVNVTTALNANNTKLYGPVNGTDAHYVLWKPAVVPTLKTSWGAVKALFR